MQQVSQIAEIIKESLDSWMPEVQREFRDGAAAEAAQRLVSASLAQLVELLGAEIQTNKSFETLINLGKL